MKNKCMMQCQNAKKKKKNLKRFLHTHVQCSANVNSKEMEPQEMPTDKGVDKESVASKYNGLSFSFKKERHSVTC